MDQFSPDLDHDLFFVVDRFRNSRGNLLVRVPRSWPGSQNPVENSPIGTSPLKNWSIRNKGWCCAPILYYTQAYGLQMNPVNLWHLYICIYRMVEYIYSTILRSSSHFLQQKTGPSSEGDSVSLLFLPFLFLKFFFFYDPPNDHCPLERRANLDHKMCT